MAASTGATPPSVAVVPHALLIGTQTSVWVPLAVSVGRHERSEAHSFPFGHAGAHTVPAPSCAQIDPAAHPSSDVHGGQSVGVLPASGCAVCATVLLLEPHAAIQPNADTTASEHDHEARFIDDPAGTLAPHREMFAGAEIDRLARQRNFPGLPRLRRVTSR
jgi:hypothetical protein